MGSWARTAALAATILVAVTPSGPASASMPSQGQTQTTTARVTWIVDGDTIDTTAGRIRIIGIDAPENGECNAARATANARRLAPVGSTVRLTLPAGENNVDIYDRKLRYVARKGIDFGGKQIKAGLADARYDSLDGFPHHPKQAQYRRWDRKYPDKRCS